MPDETLYKLETYDLIPLNAEEIAAHKAKCAAWDAKSGERKLVIIKEKRILRLKETDYLALSDTTLTDAMRMYRQGLRDIPQNHTNEAAYDLILAKDESGQLTHSVWAKP